jgi:hypothetical protein
MHRLALSIDPGGTTGFTAFNVPNGLVDPETYSIHTALEVTFDNRFWFNHFLIAHRDQIGLIILERFKLFDNQKKMKAQINSEFPSVRVIGIVEAYAHLLDLHNLIVFQEPNDRLSAQIPHDHYKALGPSSHVRDSYRHWRYYALTHRRQML